MAFAARDAINQALNDHSFGGGAALAAGLAAGATYVSGYWQIGTGALRLAEQTNVELDRVLLEQANAPSTVSMFDDPQVLNRLEVLRVGRAPLLMVMIMMRDLILMVVGLLTFTLLLGSVNSWFALLPVVAVPVIWIYYKSEGFNASADLEIAETRREALHFYDIGTDPANAKELRVFANQDAVKARFEQAWSRVDRRLTKSAAKTALVRAAAYGIFAVATAVALVAVFEGLTPALISPGDLFLLVMTLLGLTEFIGYAAKVVAQSKQSVTMASYVVQLTGEPTDAPTSTQRRENAAPDRLEIGIELRDVSFSYDGANEPALGGINLRLPTGASVAVVGENGAGKSTFVKLLCGLYHPTGGAITVDGTDLSCFDPASWSSKISAVFQDFVRFEFRLCDSVGVGELSARGDPGAVTAAIARAGASETVERLPQGMNTKLGSRFAGTDLSGGEWQRIAVARGLMRRQPILLVLDEPSGALDAISEYEILKRIVHEAKELAYEHGTIVVFVSHRYSTVQLADQIVVLDDGRLVEQGTHAELMKRGGRYASAYRRQAAAYQ